MGINEKRRIGEHKGEKLKNLTVAISKNLLDEHYEMPHAPPFGEKEEKVLISGMKTARSGVEKQAWGACPKCNKKVLDTILNLIMGETD